MQHQPSISLLIANYNNGRFFRDCYESLVAQTEKNWEAIIVDDASTDNSVGVINALIKNDSRFQLYENPKNKGVSYTKRRLAELASAPIFGFIDPDDALSVDAVSKSLDTHNKYDVGLVYSNFIICDKNLNPTSNIHKGVQIKGFDKHIFFHGEISHFATFNKNVYLKTAGIDTTLKIAEDQDIYMKMYEVAPVKYINESLYLYRIHKTGISRNTDRSFFWYWIAILKAADRRSLDLSDIEDAFTQFYIPRHEYEKERKRLQHLKNNKILKGVNVLIGKIKNI